MELFQERYAAFSYSKAALICEKTEKSKKRRVKQIVEISVADFIADE